MKLYQNFLVELFDNPYQSQPMTTVNGFGKKFKTNSGAEYEVYIHDNELLFQDEKGNINITGKRKSESFRIMSTVVSIALEYIKKHKPEKLRFSATSSEQSRINLYTKMVRKMLPKDYDLNINQTALSTSYRLKKRKSEGTGYDITRREA